MINYAPDAPVKAYLLTEDGGVFEGGAFGYIPAGTDEFYGELVFTTAMTGYIETLTDPSYFGQIVIQAFPLIGNYGIISADFESINPALSAYIVREYCQAPSNFRSEGTLDVFLSEHKIPGLYGVDTRALVRRVREYGTMNAVITYKKPDPAKYADILKAYRIKNAVAAVSLHRSRIFPAAGETKYRVVLWDFGAKGNIIRCLCERGCEVHEVPSDTAASDIAALSPDGVMLSNGPGDPAENIGVIGELKKLFGMGIPVFGICLGHQMAALAAGGKTEKMRYGHRGANQPVRYLIADNENSAPGHPGENRVFITSQNHGYAVVGDSLPANVEVTFINANDNSVEGMRFTDRPVFTVQFHPEACAGPKDTEYLFNCFMHMMEQNKGVASHA